MPSAERIAWLIGEREKADHPAYRYWLSGELALTYSLNENMSQARAVCADTPPLDFDLSYRCSCLDARDANDENATFQLLQLSMEARDAGNDDLAARALLIAGWRQSSTGDIAAAFQTYEEALSLADKVNSVLGTDLMLNAAGLYIMHGDREYVEKGIALHEESLEMLARRKKEDPSLGLYVDQTTTVLRYNLAIAYLMHLNDYPKARQWFESVGSFRPELERRLLVFTALAAVEMGDAASARSLLERLSEKAPGARDDVEYLPCYVQLVQAKLGDSEDVSACLSLDDSTSLEVRQDVSQRLVASDVPDVHLAGLESMYSLYETLLKPKMKQNFASAASRAELIRLQQESAVKSEIILKEQALKESEKKRRRIQGMLALATTVILLTTIVFVVVQFRHKKKLAKYYEQMSIVDGLTGLHNRRFFEQSIQRELGLARRLSRSKQPQFTAFCLLDIDRFKKINDNHGHDLGDQVLLEFARRIHNVIRETDILVRWGGEEFMLVARLEAMEDVYIVADKVLSAINRRPFGCTDDITLNVTCTIGIALYPFVDGSGAELHWKQWVQLADLALYYGKKAQRNCWVCVSGVRDFQQLDIVLGQHLDKSLDQGLIDLKTSIR